MGELIRLDNAILGFHREAECMADRNPKRLFYKRNKEVAGYGYLGDLNGPFALMNANDFPAILAHAETEAAKRGAEFSVEVPMINRAAIDYLLERRCKLEAFLNSSWPTPHSGNLKITFSPVPVFCIGLRGLRGLTSQNVK